jgi:assimilatory nitrate reductase catalytic subunit
VPCSVEPVTFATKGFAVLRTPLSFCGNDAYSGRTAASGAFLTVFATNSNPELLAVRIRASLPVGGAVGEYRDEEQGILRLAASCHGRIELCFFAAAEECGLPSRSAALAALTDGKQVEAGLTLLLSGGRGEPDAQDKAICACFGVRRSTIAAAIEAGCDDVSAVGCKTKAGTNCGSCRPEINALLRELTAQV